MKLMQSLQRRIDAASTDADKKELVLMQAKVWQLIEACRKQHDALNSLMNQLSAADRRFIAVRSPTYGAVVAGRNALIDCGESVKCVS